MIEFGAVLYDIGSASDGRPGYAVTLEQHVEIASGARGAQGVGGERRRWRPWHWICYNGNPHFKK